MEKSTSGGIIIPPVIKSVADKGKASIPLTSKTPPPPKTKK